MTEQDYKRHIELHNEGNKNYGIFIFEGLDDEQYDDSSNKEFYVALYNVRNEYKEDIYVYKLEPKGGWYTFEIFDEDYKTYEYDSRELSVNQMYEAVTKRSIDGRRLDAVSDDDIFDFFRFQPVAYFSGLYRYEKFTVSFTTEKFDRWHGDAYQHTIQNVIALHFVMLYEEYGDLDGFVCPIPGPLSFYNDRTGEVKDVRFAQVDKILEVERIKIACPKKEYSEKKESEQGMNSKYLEENGLDAEISNELANITNLGAQYQHIINVLHLEFQKQMAECNYRLNNLQELKRKAECKTSYEKI